MNHEPNQTLAQEYWTLYKEYMRPPNHEVTEKKTHKKKK